MRDELDTRSVQNLINMACAETDEHTLSEIILTLQSRGTLEVFDAAYHLCVSEDPYKRGIGFRVLEDLGTLKMTFPNETRDLAIHLSEKESDTNVLIAIARVLARVGGASAIQALARLQQSPVNDVRYGVIFAVSYMWNQDDLNSVIPIVLVSLLDDHKEVRYEAAAFLAQHFNQDNEHIKNALIKGTQDTNSGVRGQCLLALIRKKDPNGLELLSKELSSDRISVAAIEAASELADPQLYRLLEEISRWWDVDAQVLAEAMEKCKPKV